MQKQGFTLIELLVVIAVIAVLMAILMPGLHMAREQGRSIVCASNLKTLTLGWQLYADGNDSKIVNGLTPCASGVDRENPPWVVIPDNPIASSVEEKKECIEKGALWPYIKAIKAYHCPSDRRSGSLVHKNAYRTYTIPAGLNGEVAPKYQWGIAKACKSLTDIKNPSRKYVFLPESDNRGCNLDSWVIEPVKGLWIDAVSVWHRGRSTNFAFADAHVERYAWQSQGFLDWSYQAVDEPAQWQISRDPKLGGEEEVADYRWALGGYAYKSLTGAIQTFGGAIY